MGLGPFGLIALFYGIIGIRVVYQLIRNWKATWDTNFTAADRALVDQASFFVLVPIAVALHELGHAVAVWLFGGQVLDFGYYVFAGYVSYDPRPFSDIQQLVVTAAGTVVNLLLGALALGLVFGRRPPMRAAYNELLIQFTFISLLNALIFYPLLDILTAMGGDWSQMYFGYSSGPNLIVLVIHLAIVGGLFWAWRSPAVQARIATLTGGRPGSGGLATRTSQQPLGAAAALLRDAGKRVSTGWGYPIQLGMQAQGAETLMTLAWSSHDQQRAVITRTSGSGINIAGIAGANGNHTSNMIVQFATAPNLDELTVQLRLALEQVDSWRGPAGVAVDRNPPTATANPW